MKTTLNHHLADEVMNRIGETLATLSERYRDEAEYEDLEEYRKVLAEYLRPIEGVVVIAMTKRPFGFHWTGSDGGRRHTFFRGDYLVTKRTVKKTVEV